MGPAHARVGRRRLFSFHSKSRRRPTAAPPLARPSGSASPRGIRRLFSCLAAFKKPPSSYGRSPLATFAAQKLALRARGIRRLFLALRGETDWGKRRPAASWESDRGKHIPRGRRPKSPKASSMRGASRRFAREELASFCRGVVPPDAAGWMPDFLQGQLTRDGTF